MSRATFTEKSISPSRRTRCCAPIESARAQPALSQAGTLSQLDTPSLSAKPIHAAQPVSAYPSQNAHNMRGFHNAQYYIVKWLLTRGMKRKGATCVSVRNRIVLLAVRRRVFSYKCK